MSFFCGGDPFCEVERWPENILKLKGPLEQAAGLFLQSKFTDLILSFQVPWGIMNILFALRIFLFVGGYQNLLLFFFLVICWSYQWMEISVTLSIGDKLYSLPSYFIFSTLLMLSCDRIESPKLIVASWASILQQCCGPVKGLKDMNSGLQGTKCINESIIQHR